MSRKILTLATLLVTLASNEALAKAPGFSDLLRCYDGLRRFSNEQKTSDTDFSPSGSFGFVRPIEDLGLLQKPDAPVQFIELDSLGARVHSVKPDSEQFLKDHSRSYSVLAKNGNVEPLLSFITDGKSNSVHTTRVIRSCTPREPALAPDHCAQYRQTPVKATRFDEALILLEKPITEMVKADNGNSTPAYALTLPDLNDTRSSSSYGRKMLYDSGVSDRIQTARGMIKSCHTLGNQAISRAAKDKKLQLDLLEKAIPAARLLHHSQQAMNDYKRTINALKVQLKELSGGTKGKKFLGTPAAADSQIYDRIDSLQKKADDLQREYNEVLEQTLPDANTESGSAK